MAPAELKIEPTLCHALVEAIAASLRAEADSQGVKLVVARNSDDIVARIDRKVLGTIVMGLVGHAIAGTPRGVVHLSVLRCVVDGRKAVEISVAEIAAQQAAEASRRDGNGLELGRSQELAALLGGKIQVHCRPGEGSTYVLHFPEL
jgi:signal transduction histidine kinase